jgi:hypothetical protein
MKTRKLKYYSITTTFMSILLALVLVVGCAPKAVPLEVPDVSALMLTNVTASAYDAVPLTWNVSQNSLQSSGMVVLHADNPDGAAKLCWLPSSPATPIWVVQQWGDKDRLPLLTTKSQNDLGIYTPPVGMQYQSDISGLTTPPFVRWYTVDAVDGESFLTTQGEYLLASSRKTLDGTSLTVTEKSIWQTAVPAMKTLTLTTTVPTGLKQMEILYGSGSTRKGFVLVETAPANTPMNTPDSIWLLRMSGGIGVWVNYGDLAAFGGNIFSDLPPSFVQVGALLYFTHGNSGIGCIDTAAAAPSITVPEKLNVLLTKLYSGAPADAVYAVPAQLANYSNGLLIKYPDTDWNSIYYAVDASGTVLGSLRADKTSVTSFDANGKQGSSLPLPNAAGSISLPSTDLFQANIF